MADTIGSLVDKIATVNQKTFASQEILYEIRRMSFEQYKEAFFASEDGARRLWEMLKKTCDFNVQRAQLILEIDVLVCTIAKAAARGEDLDNGAFIQRPHKTY